MAIRSMAWLLGLAALFFAGSSAAAQNPKPKAVLKVDKGLVVDLAFTPDGKSLAVGSTGAKGAALHLWDVETAKPTEIPKDRIINSLSFSPDGKLLAGVTGVSGISGSAAYVLDPATGARQTLGKVNWKVYAVAFSPDGKTLASAEFGAQLASAGGPWTSTLWDVKTRKERAQIPFGKSAARRFLAFSPDGKTLASVHRDGIDLIATGTAKVTKRLTGHKGDVNCAAFSPDGKTLASGGDFSGSDGQTITMWEVATGKVQASFKSQGNVTRLAFSPDGKTLAVANGSFALWDVEAGKEEFRVLVRDSHKDVPNDAVTRIVAFSPDGKTIATSCNGEGSQKAVVVLWDVPTTK